jgi:catalase
MATSRTTNRWPTSRAPASSREPARPTRKDLKKSSALSILLNAKDSFEGRKLGVLVTDGVDAKLLAALTKAVTEAAAVVKSWLPT